MNKKKLLSVLLGATILLFLLSACGSAASQSTSPHPSSGMMTQAPGAGGMMGQSPQGNVPQTGMDFDQMFINMMVPHHQGAVEMAKIAQQRAQHPEVKQMADAIISGQQEEITQMKDWKKQWYGNSDTPPMSAMPMVQSMPGMSGGHTMNMQADVDALRNAPEPFDRAFIDAMIPHHQSAIDAAQLALNQSSHPELKELAQKIIDAQQKEIAQMKSWRQQWFGS